MWTLTEALPLIVEVNNKIKDYGYHLGLTGSVLFKGESDKDLDLILYLRNKPMDHAPALNIIQSMFKLKTMYSLAGDGYTSKLIYTGRTSAEDGYKRVDIFVPHLTSMASRRLKVGQAYA